MRPFIDSSTRELRGFCVLSAPPRGCEFSDLVVPDDFELGTRAALVLSEDGSAWLPVVDQRGEVWHDPVVGAEIEITSLGQTVPDGYVQGRSTVVTPDDIERLREVGRGAIDQAAGNARSRYISAGVGQELTYQAKYADALSYLRALETEPVPTSAAAWTYVAAEATATGMTPEASATRIAVVGAYWEAVIGPSIESVRIGGKDALEGLSAVEAITNHVASVIAALNAI